MFLQVCPHLVNDLSDYPAVDDLLSPIPQISQLLTPPLTVTFNPREDRSERYPNLDIALILTRNTSSRPSQPLPWDAGASHRGGSACYGSQRYLYLSLITVLDDVIAATERGYGFNSLGPPCPPMGNTRGSYKNLPDEVQVPGVKGKEPTQPLWSSSG